MKPPGSIAERNRSRTRRDRNVIITVFVVAVLILLLVASESFRNTLRASEAAAARKRSFEVRTLIDEVAARLVDAETGQRGFLLTGDEAYLEPYQNATTSLNRVFIELENSTSDNPAQQHRVQTLETLTGKKIAELQKTIDLRKTKGPQAARQLVLTGEGKQWMDQIRGELGEMAKAEDAVQTRRTREMNAALVRTSRIVIVGNGISGVLLAGVFLLLFFAAVERRRAQKAAEASEKWFSTTLSSIGDAVIATDMNGAISFMNSVAEVLTGWQLGEARGKSMDLVFDIVNKETRRPVENPVKKVFREGKIVGLADHTILLSKNGKEFDIEDSAAPITTEDGAELGVVLVFRDITGQKEAEEETRQSEERYRLLFDSNPHPVWVYDMNTLQILDVNPSAVQNYGYLREEFLSLTIKDIRPAEDIPALVENTTNTAEIQFAGVWKHRKKNGTLIYAEITSHSIIYNGRQARLVVATDVTGRMQAEEALRESEQKFRTLVEGAKDYAIFMLDPDGRVATWNTGAERAKGYTGGEILGESFSRFYTAEDVAQNKPGQLLREAAAWGRVEDEGWRVRKDGSRFWANVVIAALHDKQGKLIGFSKITRDMTARKETEQALIHAKEEAERSSNFKDQFLSTMSHELRTPLNAVLGFSDLLADQRYGPLNDKQRRYIDHISTGGKHLLRLISDILDLSKIEAGRMELVPETVAIQSCFGEVLSVIQPLADKKEHKLSAKATPGLTIRADATRFKQILLNLLGNAIKFTPNGGRIEIAAHLDDSLIRIEVRDDGPGIAADEQKHIFEAFYRLRESGKRTEGTGLGLAITQRLVELHGAQLNLESKVGHGSCFYFLLPAATEPAVSKPTFPGKPTGTAHILVIEDDSAARQLLQSQISSAGYRVTVCEEPQNAVEVAAHVQPSAITLDIVMRPKNGWEILTQLKRDPRTSQIPLIVVSIVDQPGMGALLGADEYLVKPVDKSVLLAAIARHAPSPASPKNVSPILIVEDDAPTRELIAEMLSSHGYRVATATDGAQARALVAVSLPELVILDMMLPEVSGFELLDEWRASMRTAALPVFVLTSKDLSQEEQNYLHRHAEVLLRKQQPWQDALIKQLERIGANRTPEKL